MDSPAVLHSSHSHSMVKAFIASPAETGRRSQQLSSTSVSWSSCLAPGVGRCLPTTPYDIAISRYTGLQYRDTIFSHDTGPTSIPIFCFRGKIAGYNILQLCACISSIGTSFELLTTTISLRALLLRYLELVIENALQG